MKKNIRQTRYFMLVPIICITFLIGNVDYASSENLELKLNTSNRLENSVVKSTYEHVGWYYRMVNGREQKRLWSYTYGQWVTNWIWA